MAKINRAQNDLKGHLTLNKTINCRTITSAITNTYTDKFEITLLENVILNIVMYMTLIKSK